MKYSSTRKVFSYAVSKYIGMSVILFTACVVDVSICVNRINGILRGNIRSSFHEMLFFIFILAIGFIFLIMSIYSPFMFRDVVIDDDGIGTHFWGGRVQDFKWSDVKRIKLARSLSYIIGNNKSAFGRDEIEYMSIIMRDGEGHNVVPDLSGRIVIRNSIKKYDAFKAIINEKASELNIPMILVDQTGAGGSKPSGGIPVKEL